MSPTDLGVNVALEAHRRGLLEDEALAAVMAFYDGLGTTPAPSPTEVLGRYGLSEARVLALVEETVPSAAKRFSSRLTIHQELGRGAMGVVSQAYDRVLKRVVALKSLRLEGLDGERGQRLLQRFQREAEVMARLRHPAVAQLHDANVDAQGNPYLVMEFVRGRNLERVIADEAPLDVRRVLRWGATLAEALHACHRAGVIHRDVKPSNVMITPDDDARLVDFGVALDEQAIMRLTAPDGTVGTLLYMAPEQARRGQCEARSDVYSLGATLYHALTGQPPFEAPHAVLLVEAIVNRAPEPIRSVRRDVPRPVDDLLLRCLAKAPDQRPTDAGTLAAQLQRLAMARGSAAWTRATAAGSSLVLLALIVAMAVSYSRSAATTAADVGTGLTSEVVIRPKEPAEDNRPRPSDPGSDTPPASPYAGDSPTSGHGSAEGPPDPLPPGVERGARPNEFLNTKDGSILVFVRAGDFLMGQSEVSPQQTDGLLLKVPKSDRPAHQVHLSGYFIGKYEVTWAQFRRFAAETRSVTLGLDAHIVSDVGGLDFKAGPNHPVFRVTWEQASAYCEWAGLRLPTEAEWEFAARGGRSGQRYPWGDALAPEDANLFGDRDGHATATPVGAMTRDRSPVGCFDMGGNVHEWVQDIFGPYREAAVTDPQGPEAFTEFWDASGGWRPTKAGERELRVIRGGAWTTWDGRPPPQDVYHSRSDYYQVTRRYAGHLSEGNRAIGFRVCRSR